MFKIRDLSRRTTIVVMIAATGALYSQLATIALAADQTVPASSDVSASKKKDQDLEEVVVTGSLIPQSQKENFTPVTVISAQDIQARGFADIADAIQRASFSTGTIQNGQATGGFTQGAKVTSFFGLDPSYTKYLINGTPFANYPALYNGSESFVSIAGIPTVLVDHIDILPGAQSSIYGSDAIAAVVNVVMKTTMDGPLLDARYGWSDDGGGDDRRFAIGDGFSIGALNVVAGVQYENQTPIWAYQRPLTRSDFTEGSSPAIAERDYLIHGVFGQANGDTYYFEDPAQCANTTAGFNHSTAYRTRPNVGNYCGSFQDSYFTMQNADEQTQFYSHATYDLNDKVTLYAETLLSHDVVRFSGGPGAYQTDDNNQSTYSYFEDPRLGDSDYLNFQHIFSPEEAGGLGNSETKDTNNQVRGTVGVKGSLVADWKWLADMTYSDYKLTERVHVFNTTSIESFYAKIFGPNLGVDPVGGGNQFEPNYAQFYKPLTPAQYASFNSSAASYSYTEESLARAQVTNSNLFQLPGGDAGIALQFEGGDQGWNYSPSPLYAENETDGTVATPGSGHRSRYAGLVELQLPIASMLKANLSGRYDDYHVQGSNVDKFTYNMGLEFRPFKQLLLRGRYGTAFKAPTLADEFQGLSGFYEGLTDFYTCAKEGYTGANVANCPQSGESVFGSQSGNTKLQPITAKVWDLGFVWSPLNQLAVNVDFIHYAIRNEVETIDPTKLLETEAACRLGQLDIASPTCVSTLADIGRGAGDILLSVYTPKENAAQENIGVFIAGVGYKFPAGKWGEFSVDMSFTDMVTHTFQQFLGDPLIDELNDPFYSTEFKTKGNGSVTWTNNPFSITAYIERSGRSPNYLSTLLPEDTGAPGAATISPWTIVNLTASFEVLPGLMVGASADNVANRMPPIDHSQTGNNNTQPFNPGNYNAYGRTYFVNVTYKFSKH